MEYFILNEESIPFREKQDSEINLSVFFKILSSAFKNGIAAIRVSANFDSGWYNLPITQGYYLRDWLKEQEKDYSNRIKTLISKTTVPQIPINEIGLSSELELSEFNLAANEKIKVPSLGAAFLSNQTGLSFHSSKYWSSNSVKIFQIRLNEKSDIETHECDVKNIAIIEHWSLFHALLEKQRQENCRKGKTLWEQKEHEFPNLVFCHSTKKQIENLSVGDAVFNRLWNNLKALDSSIEKCDNLNAFIKKTSLNISDESDPVKQNKKLARYREFTIPGVGKNFFGLHIKNFPGAYRLHILPDYIASKVYIGYFGKHLPTMRF